MNNLTARFSCAVLTDLSSFAELEGEWRELYQRMDAPYLSDSFDWARLAWKFVCQPRGRDLFCVVVRRLGSVVAIFPLVASRRGLWRVGSPLNSEASEYCPFLIDSRADLTEVLEAIWETLHRHPALDALFLRNVREDKTLGLWLGRLDEAVRTLTAPSAQIRFDGHPDWDSYFATRSSRMRQELRRKLRNAENLGMRFCEITDPQERQEVWQWLVRRKKTALASRGKNDWLLTPSRVDFAAATLELLGARRPLLAIKLDDAIVAAGLCSADETRVEGFVMSYDESYAKISPGALLQLYCARWALGHGLDFDLRTGDEAFKSQWANDISPVSMFAVPITSWGRLYVASERARRWLGYRVPQSFRARIRRQFQPQPRPPTAGTGPPQTLAPLEPGPGGEPPPRPDHGN
jgi:CelD/BcsL family acetyltransferase involved in cellulose biosynthesis